MKTAPCENHREAIALLAVDVSALDPAGHAALQAHLESCPGCRGHLEEMQKLCGQVRQAAMLAAVVPLPEGFHSRLRTRIHADAGTVWSTAAVTRESVTFLERLRGWMSGPRIAWAGAFAAVLIGVGSWIGQKPGTDTPPTLVSTGSPVSATNVVVTVREQTMHGPSPAPTLMAMSRALNDSYEHLDAFLSRQEGLLAANDPPSRAMAW